MGKDNHWDNSSTVGGLLFYHQQESGFLKQKKSSKYAGVESVWVQELILKLKIWQTGITRSVRHGKGHVNEKTLESERRLMSLY